MTLAFEKFIREYKATGSEKADGYSRDALLGLDELEKENVFRLLETELPWSAEWLFLVNPEKALIVAKEKEAKLRGDPYADVHMLQEQLVKYSRDLDYQQHMIEDYPNYIDSLRPLVIDSIARTPASKATLEFFKQVILVEVNPSAVARASRHLLNSLKVPRGTENEEERYRRWVADLRNDSEKIKRRAIAELERFSRSKI